MELEYQEQADKPWWQPRHPIVCGQDIIGLILIISLMSRSTHGSTYIFFLAAAFMFIMSTWHHWCTDQPWRKRIDHTAIFWLTGATMVPYWWDLYPWVPGQIVIGVCFLVGIVKAVCSTPRWLDAGLLFAIGLTMFFNMSALHAGMGTPWNYVFWVGYGLYIAMFMVFFAKWPNPKPELFGYREVEHIGVMLAPNIHGIVALALTGSL